LIESAATLTGEGKRSGEAFLQTFLILQALRGIASCMVVLYHASESWSAAASGAYSFEWLGGAGGVDIFFVISGFVMAVSSIGKGSGPRAAWHFFERRIVRVMPVYWLVTTFLVLKVEMGMVRTGAILTHIPLKDGILSYLLIPYNPEASPLLGHAWTLSYEMFFYLCLAIALWTRKNVPIAMTAFLGLLVIVGAFRTEHWPIITVLFSPFLLEFLAGLWLGFATIKGVRVGPWIGGLLGAAALATMWFVPVRTILMQRLEWGVCALLIVQAAVALEPKMGRWMPRWALLLGDASYSLYLIHPLLLKFFVSLLTKVHVVVPGRVRFEDEGLTMVFCLVLSVVVGVGMYLLVESPINGGLRRLLRLRKPVQTEAAARV
jgi:exopolysaccharide production protein ExoZ